MMMKGFTSRRKAVLKIIVNEYIATALPVASDTIYRNYRLGVSPATIRNDMAYLETEGYIIRPHTSAGSFPSDKGYRHYVESMTKEAELSTEDQHRIRELFREVGEEFERWTKLAAAVMVRLVGSAALVTSPKPRECRFRRLELVALQESVVLMVLVLSEALIKRRILSFDGPLSQDQLTVLTNKLNAVYSGLTSAEISTKKPGLPSEEEEIAEAVIDIMAAEDELEYEEPYVDGLPLMLGQPEFAQRERMLSLMEMMETKQWLNSAFSPRSNAVGVHVLIGEENREETFHDLSLVYSGYGIPERVGGTIGVIGPTRMNYHRAISTVGYMSEVLSDLVAGVCSGDYSRYKEAMD